MELIRAGLYGDVHHGAAGAAELGRHRVGLHPELRDRIRWRAIDKASLVGQVLREAVIIDAVEQIIVLVVIFRPTVESGRMVKQWEVSSGEPNARVLPDRGIGTAAQ